jgi:hypothetical protein
MSMLEPENTRADRTVVDSGVHVRDSAPVTLWQMLFTGLLVIAILCFFFYGVTSQREEVTGPAQQQASTSVPPAQTQPKAPAASGQAAKPATTGQGAK